MNPSGLPFVIYPGAATSTGTTAPATSTAASAATTTVPVSTTHLPTITTHISTPIAPRRGGIHPNFGAYVGGASLDDAYRLTDTDSYFYASQVRTLK